MTRFLALSFLFLFFVCFAQENNPLSIKAERFEVNLSSNYFEANEKIIIEQGKLIIKADKATYKESKKKINLFNNIVTDYLDVKINCQEMVFDREQNIIDASKDVKVVYKDYKVYGQKLIYYPDKGIMKFTGETTVNQNKNVLKSNDIILDLKNNKIYSDNQTSFIISSEK